MAVLSDKQLLRYNRQILLSGFDVAGQEQLQASSALIVGLGGLGCPAALYLAASGIGRLILADGDEVELSNLQRQVAHSERDIGVNKAESVAVSIRALNPDVALDVHPAFLQEQDLAALLAQVDVAIDASDNYPIRYSLNRACIATRTPLVSAAAIQAEGQIAVFDPHRGGPCYCCLYPNDRDTSSLSCSEGGILAPVVGVLGSLQAMEALKVLTGFGTPLRDGLLIMDMATLSVQRLALRPRKNCPACTHLQRH